MSTMFDRNAILRTGSMLLAGVLVDSIFVLSISAQTPAPAARPAAAAPHHSIYIPQTS